MAVILLLLGLYILIRFTFQGIPPVTTSASRCANAS